MEEKENNRNPLNYNIETKRKENKENKMKCGVEKTPLDKRVKMAPPNLMIQPFNTRSKSPVASIVKNRCNNNIATKAAAPSVYKYAEVYEKKKQATIERLLEEEKKNRIFHSRPAPKFGAAHEPKKKSHSVELVSKVTIPVTPVVLKKSKEMEEKRNQMIEEYRKRNMPQKFVGRDAHVLQEEPFKPKKTTQVVEPQPFNLHIEKRLEERKQYDEHIKKSFDEKRKQEEDERKRREEVLVRQIRKLTSFKARPNPFK